MSNYKKLKTKMNQELANYKFENAIVIAKELELILQENVAKDEVSLENNLKLEFVDINEKIKTAIFECYRAFAMYKNDSFDDGFKIYLDDKRSTPDGYLRTFWPSQVIELFDLLNRSVKEISLDHDLGDDEKGTGNDVVKIIEEKVYFDNNLYVPELKIHSDNSSARQKMNLGIKQIISLKK